jgi:phospholipid transport system substrate-binding protein
MRTFVMTAALRRCALLLLTLFPLLALAAPTPDQVVQHTVDQLLADLKANKERYRTDHQAFYDSLNNILGPVVDAEGISRSIMTVKYSRQASPEQMQRFEENFKRSLMQFYGNALLEYDNQDIKVQPGSVEGDRASVNMNVTDSKGTVYPVSYTLQQVNGQWLLRNVIINGINIGKLFRDQFADAMQKNGNDLDKTIDNWGQVVAQARQTEAGQKAAGHE